MFDNLLLKTDSYKVTHWKQYPPGTSRVYSYLEARRGGEFKEVVFFGLQYILKRHFVGRQVTRERIEEAADFFASHFGNANLFNRPGWEHILEDHDGCLPVEIRAVPEGMVVPEGNVLLTIENTCPRCFWLTNYLETVLVEVWYPCTTATISREMKRIIKMAMERSGNPSDENLAFRLHDFGFRGSTSLESAALGGAGHLVNFMGTDTMVACELLAKFYGAGMTGFSIPAAEHSTITSWGRDHEVDAYRNMLEQFKEGLVAVVSDSWDVSRAAREIWGGTLKEMVVGRKGCTVIRPDSGDPTRVVPDLLDTLGESFGFSINSKGYKVLPSYLRVIQGDGIKRHTLAGILDALMDRGWSADNISFGSGGGLLQDCDRDTQRFAMKCSLIEVGGVESDVYKAPVTDPTKNSKRGRLKLVKDENGSFKTVKFDADGREDLLRTVFRNGEIVSHDDFSEIRRRAAL